MNYKVIDKTTYYRSGVFRHFSEDCKCSTSMTARIDVTDLREYSAKTKTKFYICYDYDWNIFSSCGCCSWRGFGLVFFYTTQIAKNAIEEIVKPFMEEHPDFKWQKGDNNVKTRT